MYKLWNKLFGWNYILVQFGYRYEKCRVKKTKDGKLWFHYCGWNRLDLRDYSPLTFKSEDDL